MAVRRSLFVEESWDNGASEWSATRSGRSVVRGQLGADLSPMLAGPEPLVPRRSRRRRRYGPGVRQLLPVPADVDPVPTYLAADRPRPHGRPWVAVGMISSLDGATAVDGTSGGLGGPADRQVFRAVRAIADVILVAAGTVRAEGYRPVTIGDDARDARLAAGRSPGPARLAIVTSSLDLDLDADLFADPGPSGPPIVFTTTDADAAARAAVAEVAEVRTIGEGRVDLAGALSTLGDAEVVVCEGGPSLNGAVVDADLVDEWCVSLAPVVAGGSSSRIVAGADPVDGGGLELESLLEGDGILFGRWVRR